MRAGVPQVVMPMAYDQADNAARMRRLGVSATLFPKQFTGPRVAKKLKALMGDSGMVGATMAVSEKVRADDGVAVACRLAEELVGADVTPPPR
jgi:UDP:flavonoid glycosyltransferase YjiC (YdhE family)